MKERLEIDKNQRISSPSGNPSNMDNVIDTSNNSIVRKLIHLFSNILDIFLDEPFNEQAQALILQTEEILRELEDL